MKSVQHNEPVALISNYSPFLFCIHNNFCVIHRHEMCAVILNICVSKLCWIYFQARFKLPASFTLLKWLNLITLDKDCRLRSFSLWHCLHPTVTSSLINLKYLYILFSNNGDLCSSLNRNRNCNYTSCTLWFVSGQQTRRRKILWQNHWVLHTNKCTNCVSYYYYYYWYSALGPVWAETRVQSGDWYGSGTLHPGQVLRGSLPLLSPGAHIFLIK